MIYDLAIIGNGISAQTFLWQMSRAFSENPGPLSLAHIYADHLLPPCTQNSCATVSLNGISPGVSPLGEEMREAYFLFLEFYQKFRPAGVEEVERAVICTHPEFEKKLTRRYKKLEEVSSPYFHQKYKGVQYPSFLINAGQLSSWLTDQVHLNSKGSFTKTDFLDFAKDVQHDGNHYSITLTNNGTLKAKKVIFFTGAYAKILGSFFTELNQHMSEKGHVVRPGSFLEKNVDLNLPSFYLSIDDSHLLYRSNAWEKKLIIGNSSGEGAYAMADYHALSKLISKLSAIMTFPLGHLDEYSVATGLRHKGPRRQLMAKALDSNQSIFYINGLYKNGFTFSFLAAKNIVKILIGQYRKF